jgi:predicted HicB family RNase H-like nuclease
MKPNEKSIIVNVPEEVHREVKELATRRGMSIKDWVLREIAKGIFREREHEQSSVD